MSQQGCAIELYFDPALENQVLKAWNVLARRQISTQLIEIESRPHITLFSTPSLEPVKLEPILKILASKQEPLPLSFSSIGSLPSDGNVLFLGPTPSISLLQFQSQLCETLRKEGIEIGEEYRLDSWIPYCAVAEEVPKVRMAEAFSVLRDLKLPVSGYAMDIGLVEFSPVRELFSFALGSTIEPRVLGRFCFPGVRLVLGKFNLSCEYPLHPQTLVFSAGGKHDRSGGLESKDVFRVRIERCFSPDPRRLIKEYVIKPTKVHLPDAKRALKYLKETQHLKGTVNYGIHFKEGGDGELLASRESDYARVMEGRISASGYVFSSVVHGVQKAATCSTKEAEFVVSTVCACIGVWMDIEKFKRAVTI